MLPNVAEYRSLESRPTAMATGISAKKTKDWRYNHLRNFEVWAIREQSTPPTTSEVATRIVMARSEFIAFPQGLKRLRSAACEDRRPEHDGWREGSGLTFTAPLLALENVLRENL